MREKKKMADTSFVEEENGYQPVMADDATDAVNREASSRPNPILAKLTALVLIIPAIVLYVYILYVAFAMLVYPGSVSPFVTSSDETPVRKEPPQLDKNATRESGEYGGGRPEFN